MHLRDYIIWHKKNNICLNYFTIFLLVLKETVLCTVNFPKDKLIFRKYVVKTNLINAYFMELTALMKNVTYLFVCNSQMLLCQIQTENLSTVIYAMILKNLTSRSVLLVLFL